MCPAGVAALIPRWPREITDCLRATGPDAPRSVGLFGDQPLADVLGTINLAGIDVVQLCGEESVAYCQTVQPHATVIKALHVPDDADASAIVRIGDLIDTYTAAGCIVALDSQVAGLHGGTGRSFDWRVCSQAGR